MRWGEISWWWTISSNTVKLFLSNIFWLQRISNISQKYENKGKSNVRMPQYSLLLKIPSGSSRTWGSSKWSWSSESSVLMQKTLIKGHYFTQPWWIHIILITPESVRDALKKKLRYYLGIFPKWRTPPPHPPLLGTPYSKKKIIVYFAF